MKKGVSILLAVCMFSFTILDSVSYAAESIQQESFTSDNISQITEYEGKIEIKDENNTVVQEAYVGQQYKIQIDENFQQDNGGNVARRDDGFRRRLRAFECDKGRRRRGAALDR